MRIDNSSARLKEIIALQSALVSLQFDLAGFMNEVVGRLQSLTSATGAIVELAEGDENYYAAVGGAAAPFLGFRVKHAGSLAGLCVETGEMLYCRDVNHDPRVNIEACRKVGVASMIVVPLIRLGETVGVLKVMSGAANAFDETDIETLQLTAGLLGAALGQQIEIERRSAREVQLHHMAQTDSLTGLPNRNLFDDRLAQALLRLDRNKQFMALMYIDIDYFKQINDTHGHLVGDALLQEFTLRAKAILRPSDTLARLGGDEFALIAENLANIDAAKFIAAKLTTVVRDEFEIEGQKLNVSLSIGVAVTTNTKMEPKVLINQADAALYEVKKSGRNGYRLAAA